MLGHSGKTQSAFNVQEQHGAQLMQAPVQTAPMVDSLLQDQRKKMIVLVRFLTTDKAYPVKPRCTITVTLFTCSVVSYSACAQNLETLASKTSSHLSTS